MSFHVYGAGLFKGDKDFLFRTDGRQVKETPKLKRHQRIKPAYRQSSVFMALFNHTVLLQQKKLTTDETPDKFLRGESMLLDKR